MPYSDPAKKAAYQKEYNKKYYRNYKDSKNLVGKAVSSKTLLRDKKKQYLLTKLGHECKTCGLTDPTVLGVRSTDKTFKRTWGDKSYKSIYDYSWDDLEVIYPTLKIVCAACKESISQKEKLKSMIYSEDLPKGYTLDEDLA